MELNPYKSPETSVPAKEAISPPNARLATIALVLAILLVFSPLGGDIMFAACASKSTLTVAALASIFVVIIFAPLAIMIRQGGFRSLYIAPKRIIATLLIVFAHIIFATYMVTKLAQS